MAKAKTATSSRKRSGGSKAAAKQSRGNSKASAASKARSGGGSSPVKEATETVGKAAKSSGETMGKAAKSSGEAVGKAASKARVPLLAGTAALAGAAGGLALGAKRSRQRKVLGMKMPQPKRVKIRSRDVAKAAKEVGHFGQQVGELAIELRHARENSSGNGHAKHRSPLEVVLDGLTARR